MSRPNPIQLQKYLKGVDYPAGRQEILETAERNGASDELLGPLRQIEDREYDGPNAVSAAFSDQG
jgi:hypothetical protein